MESVRITIIKSFVYECYFAEVINPQVFWSFFDLRKALLQNDAIQPATWMAFQFTTFCGVPFWNALMFWMVISMQRERAERVAQAMWGVM